MATKYMGPGEAYTTLKAAFAAMSGGDTLIIRAGTYTGKDNWIYMAWSDPVVPPSGTAGAPTIVRAETDGTVKFTMNGITGWTNPWSPFDIGEGTLRYVDFIGLQWINANEMAEIAPVSITPGTIDHLRFFRCGAFVNNQTSNNSSWSISGGQYLLFEECYSWGAGRYGFKVQALSSNGSQKVIFRRCLVRLDDANGIATYEGGKMPIGGFITYCAPSIEFQNCIVIDSDSSKWKNFSYTMGAFGHRPTAQGTNLLAVDVRIRGCIALKIDGWTSAYNEPGEYQSAFSVCNETTTQPNIIEDCVAWDVMRGSVFSGSAQQTSNPRPHFRRVTLKLLNAPSGKEAVGITYTQNDVWDVTSTNIYMTSGYALQGVRSTYNSLQCEGSADDFYDWSPYGPGASDYCQTNSNEKNHLASFKYITQVDAGDLKGTGLGGEDRGANIIKRFGVSGSVWGETGYNTLTNDNLWPFPSQELFKTALAAYSPAGGPSGTRGFCAPTETLTHYIWNYLGNGSPYDTPSTATETGSSSPSRSPSRSSSRSESRSASPSLSPSRSESRSASSSVSPSSSSSRSASSSSSRSPSPSSSISSSRSASSSSSRSESRSASRSASASYSPSSSRSASSSRSSSRSESASPSPGAGRWIVPTSDVSKGGWTASSGTDLYAMVDEIPANDADYIRSTVVPVDDTAVLAFPSVLPPEPGTVTLHVRGRWI